MTERPGASRTARRTGTSSSRVRGFLDNRIDAATSVFLVVPLFVLYQLGVLLQFQCNRGGCAWVGNGVDFITANILKATHGSILAYVITTLCAAVALVGVVLWARRQSMPHPRMLTPVLLESAVYATLVSPLIHLLQGLVPLGAPGSGSYLGDIVASCGAGLYEELVFRAGLFAGGLWGLKRMGMTPGHALMLSGLISSVLFSAIHHVGALGDRFTFSVFFFRVLAGAVFATIYQVRGFAVAAWTHCLYDIWVFTLQRV